MLLLLSFTFVTKSALAAPPVRGSLAAQGDLIHAEFDGRPTWDYDLKRLTKNGKTIVQLTLDPVDQESVRQFQSFKSDFVRAVRIDPKGPDGKTVVSFELSGEDVESFDYLTDQPSRLIVDFYLSATAKKKASAKVESAPEQKEEVVLQKQETVKVTDRKPANDVVTIAPSGAIAAAPVPANEVRAGIFDGGDPDYDRFSIKDYEIKEAAILRSKDNYYITFPMLWAQNEAFQKIRAAAPVYTIAPKDDEENKMARLLLTLFERKRYSVYLKTLGWFKEKFPDSKYNDLIAYMTGDVYLSRWDENNNIADYELMIQAYQSAVQKFPKAPTAERASFLTGSLALERGDFMSALRSFNGHIRNEGFGADHTYSKDLARLGTAFAEVKLFRTEEAYKELDSLEKSTPFKDLKVEAAARKGDVFSAAKQYVRAIEEYQRSLKSYPEGQSVHPGQTYNLAEAMFQTGDYRTALDTYRDFVKRFPSNEEAPYAMTRMGELLDILGADTTRVVGAYLETSFRYGENPRAIIARLRLLSARMKGMKTKETENAVKEILSLAKKLDLPNIEQFATVLIADGYSGRGEYQKSVDLLADYYQTNPTSPDLETLKKRIVANISDKFRSEAQKGQFITALQTHQKYADTWLKQSDRLDTKFFLGRSFEMGGVPHEAEALYKDVLNRVYAMKGTPAEKSLLVLPHLPSTEALHLRLAAVEADRKDYNGAYEQLRLIKSPEKLSEEEQIERVDLAVRLLEHRGDLASASRYLTELLKTWQGRPELVAEPYMRLSQLEIKQGRPEDAMNSLRRIGTLMTDSGGKVSADVHARSLENLGDLLLSSKKKDEAAATYTQLLNQYEETRPLASIRYRLGRIYFDRGDVQKAAEAWNSFKGERSDFWKGLAQEQLRDSRWRDDYKKYIQRIPAMAAESKE